MPALAVNGGPASAARAVFTEGLIVAPNHGHYFSTDVGNHGPGNNRCQDGNLFTWREPVRQGLFQAMVDPPTGALWSPAAVMGERRAMPDLSIADILNARIRRLTR